MGDSPWILVHNAISPAGAETDEGLVILVLVENLVSMVLAGIAAGVKHLSFTVPTTANLDEIVSPSRFVNSLLVTPGRICKQVFFSCGHVTPLVSVCARGEELRGSLGPCLSPHGTDTSRTREKKPLSYGELQWTF